MWLDALLLHLSSSAASGQQSHFLTCQFNAAGATAQYSICMLNPPDGADSNDKEDVYH